MSRAAIVAPLVAKWRVEEGQGLLVIQLFLKQNGTGVTLPGAEYEAIITLSLHVTLSGRK